LTVHLFADEPNPTRTEAGDAAAELDAFFTALPPHEVARFGS